MPDPVASPPQQRHRIGKDELNLADWRISVPTHQQPRKEDGGKLDVLEYEIPSRDEQTQKVTLMAPSVVGLPTPGDEDLLIALLALAKEQHFADDFVRFSTADLCHALRRSPNLATRDRIEAGLTRLKALTLKYELAWYDKLKAQVEPVLITGILAEAKLVRRPGRPTTAEPKDSYVQWTNNFFQTIKAGNLTDIDLDLYFSFSRPGTKQLYRHLNKRFHGRNAAERYERDLVHLACGHLGMTKSKFVKRNLDECIRELEHHGYIVPESKADRYRKIRPGVWRVGFSLDPSWKKTTGKRGAASDRVRKAPERSAARDIITTFHQLWSGVGEYQPSQRELASASRLIAEHGLENLKAALPRLVKILKTKWPDCRTFKGAEAYIAEALTPVRDRRRREEQRRRDDEAKKAERDREQVARERQSGLELLWKQLSPEEQLEIRATAHRGHPSDVLRRRPSLAHSLCLAELRRRLEKSPEAADTKLPR